MNTRLRTIFLVFVVLGTGSPVLSQTANGGRNSFDFLNISPISRAVGVGQAYAALGDDVGAIFYNPAGLASVLTNEFNATYLSLYQSINYEFLAFAYPLAPSFPGIGGTFAFSANFLQPGSLARTNDLGVTVNGNATFSSGDQAFTLAYARSFGANVQAGLSVKYIQQTIDVVQSSLFAMDAGIVVLPPFDGMRVGIDVKNIGAQADGFDLPFNLDAGLSYRRYEIFSPQDDGALTAQATFPLEPIEDKFGLGVGGEYDFKWIGNRISVRAGYTLFESDLSGVGLTIGAGYGLDLNGAVLFLDYAFAPADIYGVSNRISLTTKF